MTSSQIIELTDIMHQKNDVEFVQLPNQIKKKRSSNKYDFWNKANHYLDSWFVMGSLRRLDPNRKFVSLLLKIVSCIIIFMISKMWRSTEG